MSKKTVVMVASILVAAGAAVAAPSLRGPRHGSLLDDVVHGFGQAKHQVYALIGASDEDTAEPRQRRGKRRDGTKAEDAAESDDGNGHRESRGKGMRRKEAAHDSKPDEDRGRGGKERIARQSDDDDDDDAADKSERRRAEAGRDADRRELGRRDSTAGAQRAEAHFRRIDKSGDGAIDASEFVTADAERIAVRTRQFFKRFDADGDGKVTREEFNRAARARVSALDVDDDDADGRSQATRKARAER